MMEGAIDADNIVAVQGFRAFYATSSAQAQTDLIFEMLS